MRRKLGSARIEVDEVELEVGRQGEKAAQGGVLVADAFLAAIAIELDALLVTTDRDFARFPGLRWRHPLG